MPSIKTRLDTSTQLKNGAHPVVLQITWGNNVRRKRIKGLSVQKKSWDFDSHCFKHSQHKNQILEDFEDEAKRVAEKIMPWNYNRFVNKLNQNQNDGEVQSKKLISFCKEYSEEVLETHSVSYSESFKALESFLKKCFKKDIWIQDFGNKQLLLVIQKLDEREICGYDYLRELKIVLSEAISRSYIETKECPIKTKYSPHGYDINQRKRCSFKRINKKRIKDLSEEEKEMVINFYYTADIPSTQKKHLAYWIIGYKLFGVNLVDLAMMKWEDISNGYWKYKRSKTGIGKECGKPLSNDAIKLLEKYDTGGKYILDILNGYDSSPKRKQRRLNNYRANMKRNYKILSKRIGFSDERYITWYSTRYTAPTIALSKGIDLNTVRTLMDHADIKTTSRYLGLVKDKKKLEHAIDSL